MSHPVRPLLVIGLLLIVGGCALPTAQTTPGSADLSRLETRQSELAKQLSALRSDLSEIQNEVRRQQAQLEALQGSPVAEKDTPSSQITARPAFTPSTTPPVSASPRPSAATETYLRAFSDFAAGRYSQAIRGFEEFLQHFPDNEYAANAQFWIGECYYAQQDYERAATEFMTMADRYTHSGRSPDALFRAAMSFQRLGRNQQAQDIIGLLRQRYPDSAAAQKNLEM